MILPLSLVDMAWYHAARSSLVDRSSIDLFILVVNLRCVLGLLSRCHLCVDGCMFAVVAGRWLGGYFGVVVWCGLWRARRSSQAVSIRVCVGELTCCVGCVFVCVCVCM